MFQVVDQENDNPLEINVAEEKVECFRCKKLGHYARHCPMTGDRQTTNPIKVVRVETMGPKVEAGTPGKINANTRTGARTNINI